MIRITPVILNLIIINVLVFVAIKVSPPIFGELMPLYNYNSGLFKPFQIVTNVFTHYSPSHLFFNMLGLFFFGPLVENTIGGKKTLVAFLTGGILSAVIYLVYYSFIVSSPRNFALLGASGGLYTILTIAAVYYPKQRVQLLFPPIPLKLGLLIAIYIGSDLYFFLSEAGDGVAHLAHLGGAFIGFVLAKFWK